MLVLVGMGIGVGVYRRGYEYGWVPKEVRWCMSVICLLACVGY
jgi:hypothetical protein